MFFLMATKLCVIAGICKSMVLKEVRNQACRTISLRVLSHNSLQKFFSSVQNASYTTNGSMLFSHEFLCVRLRSCPLLE